MLPRTHAHDPAVENYAILLAAAPEAIAAALSSSSSSAAAPPPPPRCIGNCGVLPAGERLMLGYGLQRAYWGRGYMSEAVPLLLRRYWGATPGARRLHAVVNPENVASVRILVANGFVVEEVLPGEELRAKGIGSPVLYRLERPP